MGYPEPLTRVDNKWVHNFFDTGKMKKRSNDFYDRSTQKQV